LLKNLQKTAGDYFFDAPCRGLIAGVNALIGVAILQSVMERQCDEWRL